MIQIKCAGRSYGERNTSSSFTDVMIDVVNAEVRMLNE